MAPTPYKALALLWQPVVKRPKVERVVFQYVEILASGFLEQTLDGFVSII